MDIIKIYFELIRPVDLPWQVAIFIFTSAIAVYWVIRISKFLIAFLGKIGIKLTEWLVKLLLLPEFLLTSLFRLLNTNSPPGTDSYDDLVEAVGNGLQTFFKKASSFQERNIKFPMGWIMLLMILVIVLWYMREVPDYQNTTFSEYVDWGFGLYYELQARVLR